MAYNMPWDDWIDALRTKIESVWGVSTVVPEVTPSFKWALAFSDLPMGLIETPDKIQFGYTNAIHDLDETVTVRLWFVKQFGSGDDVPQLLRGYIREMAQDLQGDRSLGGLVNRVDLVDADYTGAGGDWPVEMLEEIEGVAACNVQAKLLLVENRFT